jgi:hypothetical protein
MLTLILVGAVAFLCGRTRLGAVTTAAGALGTGVVFR